MASLSSREIAARCTHLLDGSRPRSVRDRVREIADNPLSLLPNDNYGQGGFLGKFESGMAEFLGKEAAVFMPSGTMAQPIALRIWADQAGVRTVAFHPTCHLQLHEQMAYRELHGLNAVLLGGADRLFTLADLQAVKEPVSTLLIELPQREIGGQLPAWEDLVQICDAARARGMRLHLDGARLWECAPYYGRSYAEIVGLFDSAYVSFYKILDALPGALLTGPKPFIDEARVWQRRQGGNLQQLATSAISAKIGLDRHLPRIPEYVAKAQEIAAVLRTFDRIQVVPEHPPTNLMHLHFQGNREALLQAALRIAEEDQVGLFFWLRENASTEISVSEGALGLDPNELRRLIEKLFELVRDQ